MGAYSDKDLERQEQLDKKRPQPEYIIPKRHNQEFAPLFQYLRNNPHAENAHEVKADEDARKQAEFDLVYTLNGKKETAKAFMSQDKDGNFHYGIYGDNLSPEQLEAAMRSLAEMLIQQQLENGIAGGKYYVVGGSSSQRALANRVMQDVINQYRPQFEARGLSAPEVGSPGKDNKITPLHTKPRPDNTFR